MTQQIILNGLSKEEFKEIISQCILKVVNLNSFSKKEKENLDETFLTRKEVAKLLRISLPTLHEWTKEGMIISHKIGKRVLYKLDDVKQAIAQRNFTNFKRIVLNGVEDS